MQLHSRTRAHSVQRPPLTDEQKAAIRVLARAGRSSCQIADELGIGEGQVAYWRCTFGLNSPGLVGRQGGKHPRSPLKPRHVEGEVGDAEWFKSCDGAFQTAMRAELELREKESVSFQ